MSKTTGAVSRLLLYFLMQNYTLYLVPDSGKRRKIFYEKGYRFLPILSSSLLARNSIDMTTTPRNPPAKSPIRKPIITNPPSSAGAIPAT